jgi:hypothetical protein
MPIQFHLPEDFPAPTGEFHAFVQAQINRYVQGHFRYGLPKKSKKYLSKLKAELKAYIETGNIEHLINVAVYAGLEIQQPQNQKQHFNAYAKSVTRGKI